MVILLSLIAVVMFIMTPPVYVQAQETFNLKYGGIHNSNDPMETAPAWWANELEKRTGGRVKIKLYFNSALGQQFDTPKLLRSGIVDIVWLSNAIAEFPMLKILNIHTPYIIPDCDLRKTQEIFWALYDKGFFKELDDFKPLWFQPNDPFYPVLRKKKVTTVEELKGMKMRGLPGTSSELWDALGATAVAMPAADVYTALERGTLDGLMTVPAFVLYTMPLHEVAKYWIWQPMMGGGNLVAMSQKLWNSFPPDIQAIIEKLNKEAEVWYAKSLPTPVQQREMLKEKGWEVYDLSPEVREKWRNGCYPVIEKWAEETEAKGLPARRAIEFLKTAK
ncbi:MAG: TRAP transporter substrate-binding protein DctP [Deltaproteobacteria bacterium]|nr:TRAP transporter substrate-binding protein DctP [Deltaproteobacteria bacterium]